MKSNNLKAILKGIQAQITAALSMLDQEERIGEADKGLAQLFAQPDAVDATDDLPSTNDKAFERYIAEYNKSTGSKIRGTEEAKKNFLARVRDLKKSQKLKTEAATTLIIDVMKHRIVKFNKSSTNAISYDAVTFVRKSNFERYHEDFTNGKAATTSKKFNDEQSYL